MKLKITVHGVAYEVDVDFLKAGDERPDSPSTFSSPTKPAPVDAPDIVDTEESKTVEGCSPDDG